MNIAAHSGSSVTRFKVVREGGGTCGLRGIATSTLHLARLPDGAVLVPLLVGVLLAAAAASKVVGLQ